ncbi:MAG: histidinol-phosphatase [Oscillospiraceae bacterium]|nr:histidinol-phosphatase [Oscillospiraceae bacterium]
MIMQDFHVHSTFCDGKASPEELVQAALEKGLAAIGFSSHSYIPGEEDWTLAADYGPYRAEIRRLKEKYAGQIQIWCGIEQDFRSELPSEPFDYSIGSVHSVVSDRGVLVVDNKDWQLEAGIRELYDGDAYAAAEAYFGCVGKVLEKTNADIIGHLDVLRKLNAGNRFFDPEHPRYRNAILQAVEELLPWGRPFEINTGARARGHDCDPYPELSIARYIAEHGGTFLLSSDSHRANTLCWEFEEMARLYRLQGCEILDFMPGTK